MKSTEKTALKKVRDAINAGARKSLVCGKRYRFEPAINAVATPAAGLCICEPVVCTFESGCYIGFVNGNHIFEGKPVNDQRVFNPPPGHENDTNIGKLIERLRDSYFHVVFNGVVKAILDET